MQRRGRCLRPRTSLTGRPTSYVSQTCTAGCYAAALDLILIVLAVHTAGRTRRSRSMHLRASGMRVRATRKEQSSGPSEVVYSPTHLDQRLDTLVAAGALCSGHRRRPQLFIYTRARAWAQHDQSSRGRTSCGQYAVRGDDPKRWAVASAHRTGRAREDRVEVDLPQPHAGTAADAVGALVG